MFCFHLLGVATFVRNSATPARAEEGLSGLLTTSVETDYVGCYGDQSEFDDTDLQALDNEGRAIITQHNVRLGKRFNFPGVTFLSK